MILDLKLTGCRVLTMDPAHPSAHTIGVWQGRIVGLDSSVSDLPAVSTVDLDGAVVLPGFIDAHTHLAWNGRSRRTVDVSNCTSVPALLDVLAAAPDTGEWLEASGYDRRAFPLTASDLDQISGSRKVYVADVSGHACVVNTAVLNELPGISSDGWLTEGDQLAARSLRLPYSIDQVVAELRLSAAEVLAEGVTLCAEAGVGTGLIGSTPVEIAAYQRAHLPVRVQLMVAATALHAVDAHPQDGITRAIDLGLHTGFGNDRLSLGALKLWTDGGMIARTAALTAPYENTSNIGQLADDPATMRAAIIDGHTAGWQMAIHAIGDRAIDFALSAVEKAQSLLPRPLARHRIEHCGLVRPDQLPRIASLGLIPVIQPTFLWAYGDDYADIMGPSRAPWMYRGRSFLSHGITIAGSSDRPVADGAPLRAIEFMVSRKSSGGLLVGPDEAVSVEEALAAYTLGGAYACGVEDRLGSITPGKLADFAVLAGDPRATNKIADIEVLATIVGGEWAHETQTRPS